MKRTLKVTEVALSFFVFDQWCAYIYATKTKIIGYETFEIDENGNGKVCGKIKNGTIKMNVPKGEWTLL